MENDPGLVRIKLDAVQVILLADYLVLLNCDGMPLENTYLFGMDIPWKRFYESYFGKLHQDYSWKSRILNLYINQSLDVLK